MDLPPPLEDASDVVANIKTNIAKKKELEKESKRTKRDLLDIETKPNHVPKLVSQSFQKPKEEPKAENKTETKNTNRNPSKSAKFGGFQSGFLFGSKPKGKPIKKSVDKEVIRPKAPPSNPLLMPEVQEKMKKELQTDEFLSSYEKDESLMKQMANPKFARAIEFMSRDPAACKDFYAKNDPEFFAEFIQFFGKNMERISGHMQNVSKDQQKESKAAITKVKSADEQKMEDILSRSEVKDAISNPEIARIIHLLRQNPAQAQRAMANVNGKTKKDIQVLVSNGILSFQ